MEAIHFYFDPICPWAWLTSRWATRLVELGDLEIEWRLFSLGVANLPEGEPRPSEPVGHSAEALRLLAQARRLGGNQAVARLYSSMGALMHRPGNTGRGSEVLSVAWSEAGLDPKARELAVSDPTLWQEVLRDHRAAVASCQAFGVPTLVLDRGEGPGGFGPVIDEIPGDEEARELLQDVVRMLRRGYFFELKRDREGHPAKLL